MCIKRNIIWVNLLENIKRDVLLILINHEIDCLTYMDIEMFCG